MTGQVKEDFMIRLGELGVIIEDGRIKFRPRLMSTGEYLESETDWHVNGHMIRLRKGEMGFTLCGTPVIYRLGNASSIVIELSKEETVELPHKHLLDSSLSKHVFYRTGNIRCIRVEFQKDL